MNFHATDVGFPGVKLIASRRHDDNRGYFLETWSAQSFTSLSINSSFVQDNQSLSHRRGTLRGIHFQAAPFAQAKLIRVLSGSIYDVVVDLRESSSSYKRWFALELTAKSGDQLFIPRGFAHGFVTLDDDTIVSYKVDAPYSPAHDGGIRWDDADLGIDWPEIEQGFTISEKDCNLPRLRELTFQAAE